MEALVSTVLDGKYQLVWNASINTTATDQSIHRWTDRQGTTRLQSSLPSLPQSSGIKLLHLKRSNCTTYIGVLVRTYVRRC